MTSNNNERECKYNSLSNTIIGIHTGRRLAQNYSDMRTSQSEKEMEAFLRKDRDAHYDKVTELG